MTADARPGVPWNLKDVIKALAVLVGLVIPGFIFSVLPFSEGQIASSVNPLLTSLVMILMEGVLIFLAWTFTVRKYHASWRQLGLNDFDLLRSLIHGVLWLIALRIFVAVYALIAQSIFNFKPSFDLVQGIPDMFGSGIGGLILAILVVSLVAPVAEELFFRGFIYSALRNRFGVGKGIMISAVIFAFFHSRAWLIIPVTAMGAVLAFLYEREKSIGPAIVLHALNNLSSIILIYVLKG